MEPEPAIEDKVFEIICQHKDTCSTNLNQVFESYGTNTLEAKVPIIKDSQVTELLEQTPEQKLYHTLYHKSKSATAAVDGRYPRTRNKVLKVVEYDNEVVISAGETRERSPVDPIALDIEIQQYMDERARLKANRVSDDQTVPINSVLSEPTVEDMDEDLDTYMKEASRKRLQKRLLVEQSDRQAKMDYMDADFENDLLDDVKLEY